MTEQPNRWNQDPAEEQSHLDGQSEAERDRKGKTKDTEDGDQLSSITWAAILIWAGLVFLAENVGFLDRIPTQPLGIEGLTISSVNTWSVILAGAGGLVFLSALVRTFVPAYHSPSGGNFFVAAALLGVGLGGIFGWDLIWPFILIAMGFSALGSALIQNRR